MGHEGIKMKWIRTYHIIFYKEPFYFSFDFRDWDFGIGVGWDADAKFINFRLYLGPFYLSIDRF